MDIRSRFAPSPTGRMHLGNLWIAFLNWLWTRQRGGKIILRMEDIDRDRCRKEYEEGILEDLSWMGLDFDEGPEGIYSYGPAVQSRRYDIYDSILLPWKRRAIFIPVTAAGAAFTRSSPHLMKGKHVPCMMDTAGT